MQHVVLRPAVAATVIPCGGCQGTGWMWGQRTSNSRPVRVDCSQCRKRRKAAKRAAVV